MDNKSKKKFPKGRKPFLILFLCAAAMGIFACAQKADISAAGQSKIALNVSKKTLYTGDSFKLKASIKDSRFKGKKVVWTSSNTKAASVNNKGLVKAKKSGTASITAKIKGTKYQAACTVKVKNKAQTPAKNTLEIRLENDGKNLSADAVQVKDIMLPFALAYFQGDTAKIHSYLNDGYRWEIEVYRGNADKVCNALLKGLENINGIYSYVSLEFETGSKNDGLQCLEASLIKQDDGWKIYSYGLLSEDARQIKQAAESFAKAYFKGDTKNIRKYLADSFAGDAVVYAGKADKVKILALKGLDHVGEKADGDTYSISLEFKDTGDTFQYLEISLVKQAGGWKITGYGIDG